MRTNRFMEPVAVAFGLAVLCTTSWSQIAQSADATPPAKKDVASTVVTTTLPGPNSAAQIAAPAAHAPVAAGSEPAVTVWSNIKGCSFDSRSQFFAGYKLLQARVDEQCSGLATRRASMKSIANTQDWDFAMKEMNEARSSLKAMSDELSKASPETWNQTKDKVGQAWVRTQDAYDKVKTSMTD